jgi:7-cyano-7-deazaguanine synthase
MSIVNLVSGGLDSSLVSILLNEEKIEQFPLFVNYGQLALKKEWESCKKVHNLFNLPKPQLIDISGFGKVIRSGLTNSNLRLKEDAFTPGRNLLFLLVGSSYAFQMGASAVSIGLLSEDYSIFPDQRQNFIESAENTIRLSLGIEISIILPLSNFNKKDVINLSKKKGLYGTYSCHSGKDQPCGKCIACLEYEEL